MVDFDRLHRANESIDRAALRLGKTSSEQHNLRHRSLRINRNYPTKLRHRLQSASQSRPIPESVYQKIDLVLLNTRNEGEKNYERKVY